MTVNVQTLRKEEDYLDISSDCEVCAVKHKK